MALLLVKKEAKAKRVKNLTLDRVWVKKEVKRGQNLTIDRVWVKKEVKMGQKSYQKEVLSDTKHGSKREVKKGQDLRELLMRNVEGKYLTLKCCC